jgi:hypothetical protein
MPNRTVWRSAFGYPNFIFKPFYDMNCVKLAAFQVSWTRLRCKPLAWRAYLRPDRFGGRESGGFGNVFFDFLGWSRALQAGENP